MSSVALERSSVLARFVDGLLQTFEDRRAGLTDAQLAGGDAAVGAFFAEIYGQETPRLRAAIKEAEPHLSEVSQEKLFTELDTLIQNVVIPGYVRTATSFTPRERSDFFHTPDALRMLERVGFAAAGLLLGLAFIAARFLPLWRAEIAIAAAVAGFLYPELRRFLAFRRYERELNGLVSKSSREIERIERAYLMSGEMIGELEKLGKES
ncbi:MAG: hypothetical protein IT384_14935 [Deltaproteobacteria bacterium]|nr:hypothetical protein [Deltaproteobacteria bacterium]